MECYVALGSNLGDSPGIVRDAMGRLQEWSTAPLLRSSLWRSRPVDCPPDSPPFINAVVGLEPPSGSDPESLFRRMQELEREFGRQPKRVDNEPRPLDLDLLSWGSEVRVSGGLVLPHPRAHQRAFVLVPWNEIAPGFVVPGTGRTVREWMMRLGGGTGVELL